MHITLAGVIIAIIVGLVIGALGRLVVPGRQNMGLFSTIIVGIVAALIGTVIAAALHVRSTPGFDWIQFFIQVALAAIGVAIFGGVGNRGRRSRI
ncbi:MAG TPA: GlsB/YeaQ/YmgE family stress response membrane protein [Micromonosporaceae bacterium]|nr:GlsB/YeaQ/YmgE family stress response membrane protein [Micromonosporaceae bacterium]